MRARDHGDGAAGPPGRGQLTADRPSRRVHHGNESAGLISGYAQKKEGNTFGVSLFSRSWRAMPFGITLRARAMIHWLGEPFFRGRHSLRGHRIRARSLRYIPLQLGKTWRIFLYPVAPAGASFECVSVQPRMHIAIGVPCSQRQPGSNVLRCNNLTHRSRGPSDRKIRRP
jgi:hypothetical protein